MRRNIFICVALAGITLAVFWPVGHLDFFSYDDPVYILTNPMVLGGITADSVWGAFTSYHSGNWHPVTWLSHALDCQLFGMNPGAFHRENLAFHIANTLLLFIVLRKMTKAVWRSALVAALFAWHPMHIQSVVWISERKDVLSGFFMLLTLWAYARYVQKQPRVEGRESSASIPAPDSRRWAFDYWLALIFFALGLMSKPMLVTLPAILLLLDFWPLGRISDFRFRISDSKNTSPSTAGFQFSTFKGLLWEKIPFVALSLVSVSATFWAQGGEKFIITNHQLPLTVRMANIPVFYTTYLGKLFWPENLAVFYPYQTIPFWEQAGSFLLLALLTVICLRRMRSQPGWLLAGWLWFLIMLLPVIGLVQVGGQSIADRYTYLPSIGIFVMVVWGWGEIAVISSRWRAGVTMGATALMVACLLDTRFQLQYWRDSVTLFRHSLDVTKENNFTSHWGLGNSLWHDEGDLEGAVTNFKAVLQAGSNYLWTVNSFGVHHNLGCVLLLQNKPAEAEVQFEAALKWNTKADSAFTRKCLGDALLDQGKTDEAEAEYDAAMQLMPGNPDLLRIIKDSMALAILREKLKTEPTPKIYVEIAGIQASKGQFPDAVEHYLTALRLKPDAPEILNNLAWLLATCPNKKIRDGNLAVQYARHACELDQFKKTLFIGTLAAAYAEAGRFDDAIATAQRACDLAAKNGETDLLQKNRGLLERYHAHQPYHETQ